MDIKEKIRQIQTRLALKRRISVVFRFFPVRRNKVVFDNFSGRGYGDDPKYICEALHRKDQALDLVWLLERGDEPEKNSIPKWVRTVPYGSLAALYELSTAGVWVDNVKTSYKPRKRKGQFYLQAWHSCLGLKKNEEDAEKVLPAAYLKNSQHDASVTDLMYSNNDFRRERYRKAYYYNGTVLKCSVPRCSVLFRGRERADRKVREFFSIPPEKRIVLYAPTFRADKDVSVYQFNYCRCLDLLKKHYSRFMGLQKESGFIMLLRLHPGVAEKSGGFHYDDDVKNATMYPDMQELLAAADVLISDYSACIFDAVFVRKPVFLYTPDLAEYSGSDRGLYFEQKELPFTFNESEESLEQSVKSFCYKIYVKKCDEFCTRIGLEEDGKGDDYIADLLLKTGIKKNVGGENVY